MTALMVRTHVGAVLEEFHVESVLEELFCQFENGGILYKEQQTGAVEESEDEGRSGKDEAQWADHHLSSSSSCLGGGHRRDWIVGRQYKIYSLLLVLTALFCYK